MNKKSNDHWVSQFLLKSFVRDGQLWIYDKTTKRRIRRPTKAICCEEGFTTFSPDEIPPGVEILKDGKFLEIELSKWEREQSLTIAKLMEHRTIEAISAEEFWELVRFGVWLYLCNPAHRAMLRQGRSELQLLHIKSLSAADLDNLSLEFFGILQPHDYFREQLEIAASKDDLLQSEFLGLALKNAESMFDIVREEYAWSLDDFKSLGALLCTSDRPVLLIAENGLSAPVGFNTPEAILYFPLSPDLCLTGRNVGKNKRFIKPSHVITNPDFLGMPNLLTWAKSNQYIIAAEKNCLPTPGMDLPSYTPTILKQENGVALLHR